MPVRASVFAVLAIIVVGLSGRGGPAAAAEPAAFVDPLQHLERTCFQTSHLYSDQADLRSDVAIVYGIDRRLPERIESWRDHGYRVHWMTGAAWGNYGRYLDGSFDGTGHADEAQTDHDGHPIMHGAAIPYLCPSESYAKFLCAGVQRALDAGVEAVHLEEPEFWVRAGYSTAFKREWKSYYGEDWQPPEGSVVAQWRSAKLKYYLYRRTLQHVFDYVQEYNRRSGRHVRCYVPSHSLLNYAHWRIVSPESSLARLNGCDGYIAQVWTGTARTPNVFRGMLRERTFETAFLEYGAMQNLVRATGRTVWYLNDPVEDNPRHTWDDYRRNWESTLTASLLQPEVWRYEVSPWPERVFAGRYPKADDPSVREPIPRAYATELQTVMNALNDMKQSAVEWDCGTRGIGVLVSDSLMFERGEPAASDAHLSNVYGLALPLVMRGIPLAPVQLENVSLPHFLDDFRILLLSYHGMKPLSADVHSALADWVKRGGVLVVCDDDSDPYNSVHEWWNSSDLHFATPREHLFQLLGRVTEKARPGTSRQASATGLRRSDAESTSPLLRVEKGAVLWLRDNPASLAADTAGDARLVAAVKQAAEQLNLPWRETNYLALRRGPYLIAAGLDDPAGGEQKSLHGRWVNLFDPDLRVHETVKLTPGARYFLRDLTPIDGKRPGLLASACKAVPHDSDDMAFAMTVEGVADTPAVILIHSSAPPRSIALAGAALTTFTYSTADQLVWIRFTNQSKPRELTIQY
jgi:hypothetical protein